jgi:hypothetical protein
MMDGMDGGGPSVRLVVFTVALLVLVSIWLCYLMVVDPGGM